MSTWNSRFQSLSEEIYKALSNGTDGAREVLGDLINRIRGVKEDLDNASSYMREFINSYEGYRGHSMEAIKAYMQHHDSIRKLFHAEVDKLDKARNGSMDDIEKTLDRLLVNMMQMKNVASNILGVIDLEIMKNKYDEGLDDETKAYLISEMTNFYKMVIDFDDIYTIMDRYLAFFRNYRTIFK